MNLKQLYAIFANYIEKFEYINGDEHREYYKWQVCNKYKDLMDHALTTDTEHFSEALYEVKKCTKNIIDSYTQPFYGLVKFAEKEPETVRTMFQDLYADDQGVLQIQMEKIRIFFNRSNELLEKYFPGSYLYKQNSHAVSAYLFLYAPDNHYMYKANQSKIMADCIEFYDDWGTGDNINLISYYRMCNEILSEIKQCPELLKTNQSRYDGRLKLEGGKLHEDKELHILLFDLIYCASVYDLYENIVFTRLKTKEKQLIIEKQKKAKLLEDEYMTAKYNADVLEEAMQYLLQTAKEQKIATHKVFGVCEILDVDDKYIKIKLEKNGEEKKLSLTMAIGNGILIFNTDDFTEKMEKYRSVYKKAKDIPLALELATKALKPYREYLD